MKPLVKICGITSLEDAHTAAEAGADAIGFVFCSESPRYIHPEDAAAIIKTLPPFISSVGLFVNHSAEEVQQVCNHVPLDVLQFHGDEPPRFLMQFSQRCMKALRIKNEQDIQQIAAYEQVVSALLLDAYHPEKFGGSGTCFNWKLLQQVETARPVIIAGGLTSVNVSELLARYTPYGVDVSSGVEKSPGLKDVQKIRAFIDAVRR